MIDDLARGGIAHFSRPAITRVTLFTRDDQFWHMRSGRRNNYAFGFQVIFQGLGSVLAADTAELHSAERHLVISDVQRIDPHVTGLQTLRSSASLSEIL